MQVFCHVGRPLSGLTCRWLAATLHQQFADARRLEAVIRDKLCGLGLPGTIV